MNLYIDVGNTATKFAVDNEDVVKHVLTTDTSKILENVDYFLMPLPDNFEKVFISSVVPDVSDCLKKYFLRKYNIEPSFINPHDECGLKIDIDNQNELGADLLCDLAAANHLFKYPLLVIDLGTATKFLFIDNQGVFYTCAIVQGLELSLKNLSKNTALLPLLSFEEVKPLLENKNTKDVLVSSAYYSHVDTINGMVKRYKEATNYPFTIVLTGGNINIVKDDLDFEYQVVNNLCLLGIKVIVEKRK